MDVATLAYLAGAIDSDGTIGIKRSTYAMRHGNGGQPTYSERVALRHVTPQIPHLLRDTFGGGLRVEAPQGPNRRPMWSWTVTDLRAAECLRALRPYLKVKTAQADTALALRVVKDASKAARVAVGRGHVGAAVRPEAIGIEMHRLYDLAHELNRVGAAAA